MINLLITVDVLVDFNNLKRNCLKSLTICRVVIRDSNVFVILFKNFNEVPIQGSKIQLIKLLMTTPLHMLAVDSSKRFPSEL